MCGALWGYEGRCYGVWGVVGLGGALWGCEGRCESGGRCGDVRGVVRVLGIVRVCGGVWGVVGV